MYVYGYSSGVLPTLFLETRPLIGLMLAVLARLSGQEAPLDCLLVSISLVQRLKMHAVFLVI